MTSTRLIISCCRRFTLGFPGLLSAHKHSHCCSRRILTFLMWWSTIGPAVSACAAVFPTDLTTACSPCWSIITLSAWTHTAGFLTRYSTFPSFSLVSFFCSLSCAEALWSSRSVSWSFCSRAATLACRDVTVSSSSRSVLVLHSCVGLESPWLILWFLS